MEISKIKSEWDLTPLFKGIDDPKIEEERKRWREETDKFISKWKGRSDYLQDPKTLKEALDDYENWSADYGSRANEAYFFWLKMQLAQNDPKIKAKFNKVEEFSLRIENDMMFFLLNISKIPEEMRARFLVDGSLSGYKHFLEMLFAHSKHLLSENEEKIMNLKSVSSYSAWVRMVEEALVKEEREVVDEDGNKVLKGFSDILSRIDSQDKKVRDCAAAAFNDILEKNSDIAEAEINAIFGDKKINDELRGYGRPDGARHLSDDLDSSLVDSLIQAVSENFSISREYYGLKAKLMGVEKLKYHERNVEYGAIERKYSYDEAIKIVSGTLKSLDDEFAEIFRRFVENGQIDAYPKKGKRQGAFCVHFLKSQPIYVLLNHTGKLKDVKTFAHEMGHAINNDLMREKQNALNFDSPLSTAEVASTFMEDFVLRELVAGADDEVKLMVLVHKLKEDVSSILRQIACYMFEQELHQVFRINGYVSKGEIGKLFQKHMGAYMGDFVELSPGSENWWVYWSHIREYFYNYSYACGLLISKVLQKKVREDPAFIAQVKKFLSAGTYKSPKEIFAEMGLDITRKDFWEVGLKEIRDSLEEAKALAKKLGRLS